MTNYRLLNLLKMAKSNNNNNILTGDFLVRVIDYDGTILKEAKLSSGEKFELPNPPYHKELIFQEWSSPVDIINNCVTVEDQDIFIGPLYTTVSGATEIDIELTKVTGLTIRTGTNGYLGYTIDWGDGTINTEVFSHTYENYGKYTIKIYNIKRIVQSMIYAPECYGVKHVRFSHTIEEPGMVNIVKDFYNMETITMPSNMDIVTAFDDCFHLKCLILPPARKDFNKGVAQYCYSLETVVMPKGTTVLGEQAFYYCYKLENLTIPNTVTSIGGKAFGSNYKLKNIKIPKTCKIIGTSAFGSSRQLKELDLSNVESDDLEYLCTGCVSLEKIKVPQNSTKFTHAFRSCFSLKNVEVPSTVINIDYAFQENSSLEELILPNEIITITSTITNCTSLNKLILPEKLTIIKDSIYHCESLKEIKVPSTLQTIEGSNCFSYCTSAVIYDFSELKQIPTLGSPYCFSGINLNAKIIVPDELYEEWIVATNWTKFSKYIYKLSEVTQ